VVGGYHGENFAAMQQKSAPGQCLSGKYRRLKKIAAREGRRDG